MSRKHGAKRAGPKKDRVWVCRGCCCGTRKKHPGVDHKGLERLARDGAREAGAKYEVTDCLGPCGQGNIVVTRVAGTIRWFRKVNDEDTTKQVVAHVRDGGELPLALERHLMPKRTGEKPDP